MVPHLHEAKHLKTMSEARKKEERHAWLGLAQAGVLEEAVPDPDATNRVGLSQRL